MKELQDFLDAKNALIDRALELQPQVRALEAEAMRVESLGRTAGLKASKVREGMPRITFRIDWPEGQEPVRRDPETPGKNAA